MNVGPEPYRSLLAGLALAAGCADGGVDSAGLPADQQGRPHVVAAVAVRSRHLARQVHPRRRAEAERANRHKDELVSIVKKLPLPVVYAGKPWGSLRGMHLVDNDNEGGAVLATEHLKSLGRKKVVHVSGPLDELSAIDRLNADVAARRYTGVADYDDYPGVPADRYNGFWDPDVAPPGGGPYGMLPVESCVPMSVAMT